MSRGIKVRTGTLARFWLRIPKCEVELCDTGLVVCRSAAKREYSLPSIQGVKLSREGLWYSLLVRVSDEAPVLVRGLSPRHSRRLAGPLLARCAGALAEDVNRTFEAMLSSDVYVSESDYQAWRSSRSPRVGSIRQALAARSVKSLTAPEAWRRLERRLKDAREEIDARNDRWVREEIERHRDLFERVERFPLTARQCETIVRAEDHALVIAGPGTGKTTTVLGKIEYLVRAVGVPEDQILVLSFSRKSVTDLEARAAERLSCAPEITTFHGFGLGIIAEVEGEKPTVSRFSENSASLTELLGRFVDELLHDSETGDRLRDFLFLHLRDVRTRYEFDTDDGYIKYLRSQCLRTLRGEFVKSHQELMIANWLLANGVEYEYEPKYEVKTATLQHSQYCPDFYMPGYEIYIEHFGVDRAGNTAPFIDAEKYRAGMEWKRALHRENGTELVETYSYEEGEGTLLTGLAEKLEGRGVELQPIGPEALARALRERGETRRFVELLGTFLNLYKSLQCDLEELRHGSSQNLGPREENFLEVFSAILRRYEQRLAEEDDIDFHDMINTAIGYVESGRWTPRFQYVIVDEFQDIAHGRYRLLKSILDHSQGCKLFAVGDDCQSIYRFTGSDVSIMTDFEKHFGFTCRNELDLSYRLSDRMIDLSNRFILENPIQIEKNYHAHATTYKPPVVILQCASRENRDDEAGTVRRALEAIERQAEGRDASVLVIGRYKSSAPEALDSLLAEFANLKARFVTAHGSKGLEADFSILLGLVPGRYGFPCEIVDDRLLGLVLPRREDFRHAEERRLFYVTLTRARRHTYIITGDHDHSAFVDELVESEDDGFVDAAELEQGVLTCPGCEGKRLVRRSGRNGEFWGCKNYPYCEITADICRECEAGALLPKEDEYRCTNRQCHARADRCSRCGEGMLRTFDGAYGAFLGCSRFRAIPPCNFTRSL